IELQKEAKAQYILNYLLKHTNLRKKFYLNLLVLVDGIQPKTLSLIDLLNLFLEHRREIVRRRTEYLLARAKERAHILEGLLKCLLNIDLAIKIIRKSKDRAEAKKSLISSFKITEIQAEAILEIKLASLVRMEREKLQIELKGEKEKIKKYSILLSKKENIDQEIEKELKELKERFQDKRRTHLSLERIKEIDEEELVPLEATIVFLTQDGRIKRLSPEILRVQKRGGKGMTINNEESFSRFIFTDTHSHLLFFTSEGRVFKLPVFEIEEGKKTNRAKPLSIYFGQEIKDNLRAILELKKEEKNTHLVVVTKLGQIKKMKISEFEKVKKTGTNAMLIKEGDALEDVEKIKSGDEILIFTKNGQAIRFAEKEIKEMGKNSGGIKGISLKKEDLVVGLEKIDEKKERLFLISEQGLGKIISLKEIKKQKRGGKGIRIMKINLKSGNLVFGKVIFQENNLILGSKKDHFLRTDLKSVPQMSRNSQGVRLIKISNDDKINWAEIF
ncbi:MAG: DNA gyrase C-terminal beta-propeller domain-containing protein, partial [Minisyncoccales bacterium]